jgi:hypothetical protein
MNEELTTDKEYLENIYNNLHNLVEYCKKVKRSIEDMDNFEIVHDLEFQLEFAFKILNRKLNKEQ